MPKSLALEDALAALGGLRREPLTAATIETLRHALRAKVCRTSSPRLHR
jgi:hypothetical protein